jgi:hypothetical protein
MDFADLCEELKALERRVMVQSLHIQQAKLEAGSGTYQPGEKLEVCQEEKWQQQNYHRKKLSSISMRRLQSWSLQ